MRKNTVYLLVGLVIGILVFNSIGFAKSMLIEAEQLALEYFFNGEQKAPEAGQEGFVYNGRTYVPIRFISEALGKEVAWDGDTNTISISDPPAVEEKTLPDPVNVDATAQMATTAEQSSKQFAVYNNRIFEVSANDTKNQGIPPNKLKNMSELLAQSKAQIMQVADIQALGIYGQRLIVSIPCYDIEQPRYRQYNAFYYYNLYDDSYGFLQNSPYTDRITNTDNKAGYIIEDKLMIKCGDTKDTYLILDLDTLQKFELITEGKPYYTIHGDNVYYFTEDIPNVGEKYILYKQRLGETKRTEFAKAEARGYLKVIDGTLYCYDIGFSKGESGELNTGSFKIDLDGFEPIECKMKDVFI